MLSDTPIRAVLASPRRLEILRLTWDEERQAGDISRAMPDVTWGAVSLHMRALVDAGLLQARQTGRQRFYRADRVRLQPLAELLEQTWADALWRLKLAAELEATRRGPRPRRRRTGPATPRKRKHR